MDLTPSKILTFFTIPKIAKSLYAYTKQTAYMTTDDFFWKFVYSNSLNYTPPTSLTTLKTANTPFTTLKIAKSACAMSKPPAYMTMNNLFQKFVSRTIQHQHATEFRS